MEQASDRAGRRIARSVSLSLVGRALEAAAVHMAVAAVEVSLERPCGGGGGWTATSRAWARVWAMLAKNESVAGLGTGACRIGFTLSMTTSFRPL
jgi:hypothetical protein